jgi:rhamnosyltransferase
MPLTSGIPGPISVVIRNLNEAASLRKVLVALRSQNRLPAEIIVVDNESTDDSREVAREYDTRVVSLPRPAFTYGRALNVGIREASQPFVLNLSAHSVPLGRTFIDDVLEPFADPTVAAVTCRNVARRQDLADWPVPRRLIGAVEWETLFSQGLINSAAAIRRDLWLRFPFDEDLPFSEDALWSRTILSAGNTIATSTAMYVYLREHGFLESIRRRDREEMATYEISGRHPSYSANRLMHGVFVRGPKAALRVVAYECLLCVSKLTVPLRARRRSLEEIHALSTYDEAIRQERGLSY